MYFGAADISESWLGVGIISLHCFAAVVAILQLAAAALNLLLARL